MSDNMNMNGNYTPNPANTNADANQTQDAHAAPVNPLEQFVEHQKKAIEESVKAVDALLPEGFKTHGEAARKEFFKGFKVLVDAAISELEKANREFEKQRKATQPGASADGGNDKPSSTGATKVKVQVD